MNHYIFLILTLKIGLDTWRVGIQRATYYWGNLIQQGTSRIHNKMQDNITPRYHVFSAFVSFGFLIVLAIISFLDFKWYVAILILITSFIVPELLGSFLPNRKSDYYRRIILTSLEKRRINALKANNYQKYYSLILMRNIFVLTSEDFNVLKYITNVGIDVDCIKDDVESMHNLFINRYKGGEFESLIDKNIFQITNKVELALCIANIETLPGRQNFEELSLIIIDTFYTKGFPDAKLYYNPIQKVIQYFFKQKVDYFDFAETSPMFTQPFYIKAMDSEGILDLVLRK
jgi:hypothetical protein